MLQCFSIHRLTESSARHGALTIVFGVALCLAAAPVVFAQSISDSDFIELGQVAAPLNAVARIQLPITIRTSTPAMALTIPLRYGGHPALHMDMSMGDQGVTFDMVGNNPFWAVRSVMVDQPAKTILIGFLSFGNPVAPVDGPLATLNFITDSTTLMGNVVLDTVLLPPDNHLALVDESAQEYIMQYTPGVVRFFEVGPTLQLDPDRLDFKGYTDSTVPPSQTFTIRNVGTGSINWTAIPDEPWISVHPVSGTGDTTITVRVHSIGMAAGNYTGYVVISDTGAVNSPRKVRVNLELNRRSNAADSDYVQVASVVAPVGRRSHVNVGVRMGSTGELVGVIIPLSYAGSPYVTIDTTLGTRGVTYDELGADPRWAIRPVVVDPVEKTVVIAFISFTRVVASEGPLATLHFLVDSADTAGEVPIDTMFVPPAHSLLFQPSVGNPIIPAFTPGAIAMAEIDGNICLMPDSICLEAVQFSEVMPCAEVLLQNCAWDGPMEWTAATSCDWLSVDPHTGYDDSVYLHLCATTTADPGLHVCTLTVSTHTFPPFTAQAVVYYHVTTPGGSGRSTFEAEIVASIPAKLHDDARFGTRSDATDGYDPGIDLFEPPPPPRRLRARLFPPPRVGAVPERIRRRLRTAVRKRLPRLDDGGGDRRSDVRIPERWSQTSRSVSRSAS